jgi:DNA helicase HerA-like ATPase
MLYSTTLLWLLAELFENLPEVGDLEKPKLAFFFDEAHLLFNDAPKALLQRMEQVVRLIRSKGVGVYFVTQNPTDIPDTVLGQLGNRVNHALRAYTEKDRKAVRAAAQTMRANPEINTETAITELGVGEALVSFLEENGNPGIVDRAFIMPPASRIGPVTSDERRLFRQNSPLNGAYDQAIDRDSAYEMLERRMRQTAETPGVAPAKQASGGNAGGGSKVKDVLFGNSRRQGVLETAAKTAARSATTAITNQALKSIGVNGIGKSIAGSIVRGILGSILGGRR